MVGGSLRVHNQPLILEERPHNRVQNHNNKIVGAMQWHK